MKEKSHIIISLFHQTTQVLATEILSEISQATALKGKLHPEKFLNPQWSLQLFNIKVEDLRMNTQCLAFWKLTVQIASYISDANPKQEPDAGKDWGQEEKGMTEDEMVGWHHWLNGHEFEWTQGVGDWQGGLEYCDSWGHKESDTKERLNWTEHATLNFTHFVFLSKILQYY